MKKKILSLLPGLMPRTRLPAAAGSARIIWRQFLQFEAPEYSAEGIASFRASLDDKERTRSLSFYGAFDENKLVGVLCMRAPQHIGDFFVDAAYHRRGIGRRLFEAMRRDYSRQVFTVNSSPYAVGCTGIWALFRRIRSSLPTACDTHRCDLR